jgi:putative holliday junction resolvase
MAPKRYICLDVGERRVGVAIGDASLKMAWPHSTLLADDNLVSQLQQIVQSEQATGLVVGRPRNQSGEVTKQTKFVEDFVRQKLGSIELPVFWQDESVTSAVAEERLKASGKPYAKEDIDSRAAAIILQDFLEAL